MTEIQGAIVDEASYRTLVEMIESDEKDSVAFAISVLINADETSAWYVSRLIDYNVLSINDSYLPWSLGSYKGELGSIMSRLRKEKLRSTRVRNTKNGRIYEYEF